MKRTLLIFLIVFIVMQFIRPEQNIIQTSKELEIKAPLEVMSVLKTSCYDCHSNNVVWPSYSQIAPFSWIISSHVKNGRKALNFSIWENYTADEKKHELKQIYRTVYASMPLQSYTAFHEEAVLNKKQKMLIRDWTNVRKRK